MAQNLRILRRRIKTADSITQVTRAMEMIAASRIKKAQNSLFKNIPYAQKITEITQSIAGSIDPKSITHPYILGNSAVSKLLIVISSDKGLCGALNSNLFKKLLEIEKENTFFITVGKKAERFCVSLALQVIAAFPMGTALPNYQRAREIKRIVDEYYLGEKASGVDILFTSFKSIFSQVPTVIQLLPLGIEKKEVNLTHLFEPSQKLILDTILPHYLEVLLYQSLIDAYTSEQSSRMISMQNAKNNATEIASFLALSYNKARQERITNELLDLSNSQLAGVVL